MGRFWGTISCWCREAQNIETRIQTHHDYDCDQ